jgi:outer membrane protein OmpA-like peptidoglycan-associated protein
MRKEKVVKMKSLEVSLTVAIIALLSYAACTAQKSDVRHTEAEASAAPPTIVDGVFASDEHLSPIYFDLNRSKPAAGAVQTIQANAEWLKNQPPYLVRIVGFADSRGSVARNERLAERRANQLRDAYIAAGISKDRISIATRGAEAPACEPVNEDCLAKSRRCETLIDSKFLASR